MNDGWRKTEMYLHRPIVKKSMTILIFEIDDYIRKTVMGEVLPY